MLFLVLLSQGIDIVPTVVQLNSDLKFFNYEDQPIAPVQGGSVTIDRNVTINNPAGGPATTADTTTLTGTVPAGGGGATGGGLTGDYNA